VSHGYTHDEDAPRRELLGALLGATVGIPPSPVGKRSAHVP
jgi:hypothetical protein